MSNTEITDVLTPEGIEKLKKGQILMFNNKGRRTDLKITKIDRKNKRVWAEKVITFRSDEIVVTTGKKRQSISEYMKGGK